MNQKGGGLAGVPFSTEMNVLVTGRNINTPETKSKSVFGLFNKRVKID